MEKEKRQFELITQYEPNGDQPQAIKELIKGLANKTKHQVLLGATGTGKTFTMANIINKVNKPTLILAHNKTLAMQLYIEFKELFPNNRVEYYVSHFDFYQPEAYIAARDQYIDKDSRTNQDLEMMRLSAMNALLLRTDTIVVASVAAIYGTQNPLDYSNVFHELKIGQKISKKDLLISLLKMGYVRNDTENIMGTFAVKGDVIKVVPGYSDKQIYRISTFDSEIESIDILEPINNAVIDRIRWLTIYPATAYVTDFDKMKVIIDKIKRDLIIREKELLSENKMLEANRLIKRTNYDLEMLEEFGLCSGIENYSMYLDYREPGETPFVLLDYFGSDFLTIIDESHMMIPQCRGMFNTDRSRKQSLVNYGFRLPSAMDNRPLNFEELESKLGQIIYTSATPGEYELEKTNNVVTQQIIRPTGLLDPVIEVVPTEGQMHEIINQIKIRSVKNERVLITALTIRMSEDITSFLQEQNIKVAYIHSELKTFERNEVLVDLRRGVYDALVGVNLLREGLDLPEVSLVCILDADKQGFLRNTRSLIQTVGRAARNSEGKVMFFADTISNAMKETIDETQRRREIQEEHNLKHNITPKTINKKITDIILDSKIRDKVHQLQKSKNKKQNKVTFIEDLRKEMLLASRELDFEKAAQLRDLIIELQAETA